MKTTRDLLKMVCDIYFKQLENIYELTPRKMLPCTMCALSYDYIARGDY